MGSTIVLIGAGSFIFARKIVLDILTFPELRDLNLVLMDIDADRLSATTGMAQRLLATHAPSATLRSTTDRRDALRGADFILAMFEPDGIAARRAEVETAQRHGVPQAIGDTLGPPGIFKGVRTATVLVDLAHDMEALCPHALLMSYVNPMAICCWAVNRLTSIRCVGMCHGLAHTLTRLAHYLGLPDELETTAAGINHMTWLLTLTHRGRDVYPQLKARATAVAEDDPVRFQLLAATGYFLTESPYHTAEYMPYFRGRFGDLRVEAEEAPHLNAAMGGWRGPCIQPSTPHGGMVEPLIPKAWDIQLYQGMHAENWRRWLEEQRHAPVPALRLSEEYAARIIHGIVTGTTRRLSLNVANQGHVTNLTPGCTVEVPTFVDGLGLHPQGIGRLPTACGALCQRNVDVQGLVIEAMANEDPEALFQAMLLDPLTGACLEPDAIRRLYEDLLATDRKWLPGWLRPES